MWGPLKRVLRYRQNADEKYFRRKEEILHRAPVPVFWLFGKTGSGKTSVIKNLTGAEAAEIGSGFRPQTRRSQRYDFPSADSPLLRFLDTRGLGEATYDPAEDIAEFDASTHLMIVTVRLTDHALAGIIKPLRAIRGAKAERPVVLVLTGLHAAYAGQQHPEPDPFLEGLLPDTLPASLRRNIQAQQQRFTGLVDRIVPIDFTRPEEGFTQSRFGEARLVAALVELLPAAYRQTLLSLEEAMQSLKELNERRAAPYILSHSMMAATAAAVPLPWVDIPAVTAIQSNLVIRLASLYGQELSAGTLLNMAGPVAGRLLARMGVRETLKFFPFVGSAANAALAYAYTYGLGKACCWFFGQVRQGNAPAAEDLERIWREQVSLATAAWKQRGPQEQPR